MLIYSPFLLPSFFRREEKRWKKSWSKSMPFRPIKQGPRNNSNDIETSSRVRNCLINKAELFHLTVLYFFLIKLSFLWVNDLINYKFWRISQLISLSFYFRTLLRSFNVVEFMNNYLSYFAYFWSMGWI